MGEAPAFTPVSLLTGFLGSGKTTLLRRLLADPALGDTAVVINELGEVALDHLMVERLDDDIVLLASGCLCCTVRGELAQSLRHLLSRRDRGQVPPFSRIVIESTGLADPFPVLTTLRADPVLRHHVRSAGVVTTVDAVNGTAQLAGYAEAMRQVAAADLLVVTKTDLADRTVSGDLAARLRLLNPVARLLRSAEEPIGADHLLRLASVGPFRAIGEGAATGHGRVVATSIVMDQPVDWTFFALWLTMLVNRHGEAILRVKGILYFAGEERPVAVNGVRHLIHSPEHLPARPGDDRVSRLVVIADGLDPATIRRSFETFQGLASPVPA